MAIVTRQFEVAFADASKANVVQSALLVNPGTQSIALTINVVNSYRQNEIDTAFLQLRNRIVDTGGFAGVAATLHYYVPVGAGDAAIVLEPILANIPDGVLTIGLAGSFRNLDRGSTVFSSMVEYCMNEMHDNYLKQL